MRDGASSHHYSKAEKCFMIKPSRLDEGEFSELELLRLPCLDDNYSLVYKIYNNMLDEEDRSFIYHNYDEEVYKSEWHFMRSTYLWDIFEEARRRAIPVLIDSWERKHNLNIDWQHVPFVEIE